MTLEGRLTLMDLIRKLRYGGYLERVGITELDPAKSSSASSIIWPRRMIGVTKPQPNREEVDEDSEKDDGEKVEGSKDLSSEPDIIAAEPVKLYYLVDRRNFLDQLKSVYAAYAA
jgi:hypothetical protein